MSEEDFLSPEARMLRGPLINGTKPKKDGLTRFEVFLVYKPWQTCKKCCEDPNRYDGEDTEHVCPHTRKKEYETLLNRLRSSQKDSPIKLTHDQWVTKFNEVMISVTWEEPTGTNPGVVLPKKIPNL